jgi:hypothetical protein
MSADILSSEVIYFNWYNSVFKKKPGKSLGRLRQEDGQCKASLGYIVRPCLKKIA